MSFAKGIPLEVAYIYAIIAKNFDILAKFCCHSAGIFLRVDFSLHAGRSRRCRVTVQEIYFFCSPVLRDEYPALESFVVY